MNVSQGQFIVHPESDLTQSQSLYRQNKIFPLGRKNDPQKKLY